MRPEPLSASLAADKYHGSRRRHKTRLVDAMTFFLFVHHRTDVHAEILVTGILAQQGAQVMILLTKEAGTKLAVGGQPDTRTVSAKRLGNRRDQADLAPHAVRETILARCLARLVGNLHQRPAGMNSSVHFGRRYDRFARPMPVRIERHELDEAHDHAAFPRELGER